MPLQGPPAQHPLELGADLSQPWAAERSALHVAALMGPAPGQWRLWWPGWAHCCVRAALPPLQRWSQDGTVDLLSSTPELTSLLSAQSTRTADGVGLSLGRDCTDPGALLVLC